MKTIFKITLLVCVLTIGISGAHAENESPVELWNAVQSKKASGDEIGYFNDMKHSISIALNQLYDGKIEFSVVAPWLVEAIRIPDGKFGNSFHVGARFSSGQSAAAQLARIPTERFSMPPADFMVARRRIAEACIEFYGAVYNASFPLATAQANDRLKVMDEELRKMPPGKLKGKMADVSIGSGGAFSGIKDPEFRDWMERRRSARVALDLARSEREYASKTHSEILNDVGVLLKKLYAQPPAAGSDLIDLLRSHRLEDSPLATVVGSK